MSEHFVGTSRKFNEQKNYLLFITTLQQYPMLMKKIVVRLDEFAGKRTVQRTAFFQLIDELNFFPLDDF